VFLACLPLYAAFSAGSKSFGVLDTLALIVTAGAIIIETTADAQLRNFTKKRQQPGAIITIGLWAYSRHPNYFGEIMFWWGIYLFGLAADFHYWWTIIGPLSVTLLFTVVSIPLMEKRNLEEGRIT
jgi:steroid 5-alpha reductase family enzyme